MEKKILLSGGTGMVGQVIADQLLKKGYIVNILTRSPQPNNGNIHYYHWDIKDEALDEAALDSIQGFIHLAGASIAERWTDEHKKAIIDSRVNSAALILEKLKARQQRVPVVVSASASGYYPPNTGTVMDENHPVPDSGFLGQVCVQWEAAAQSFSEVADSVVINRIGIVLSGKGGALEKMLPPFKANVAPYFGNGKQYYSWVHIEDLASQFVFTLENQLTGVYNAGTHFITQKDLNKAIARIKGKSVLHLPTPVFALQLALGNMKRILTDSVKMSNEKIRKAGWQPEFDSIDKALADILKD